MLLFLACCALFELQICPSIDGALNTTRCIIYHKKQDIRSSFDAILFIVYVTHFLLSLFIACSVKTCPINSNCLNVNPSVCRCKIGYVPVGNECVSGDYYTEVDNVKLNKTWNDVLLTVTSAKYILIASDFESALLALLKNLYGDGVLGVQVIYMKKGSVSITFIIVTKNSTIIPDAATTIKDAIQNKSLEAYFTSVPVALGNMPF